MKKLEPNKLAIDIINDLDNALKKFGIYTYEDKGADEVMNTIKWVEILNNLSIEDVAKTLTYILDNHKHGLNLVESFIQECDHREDFDDLFEYDDRFYY